MKLFKIYTYAILVLALLVNTSCNLTDVTDVEPVYQVSEDKVITNLDQAQTVLYGTYGILKNLEFTGYAPGLTSLMGVTMKPGSFAGSSENAFFNNDVSPDNFYAEIIYAKMYFLINNANHVITKTALLEADETRKKEIIGEARALRALSHFYLLRLWGQFYDINSEYGIVLKEQPIKDATVQPRATVSEVYELILADLDYAIQNASDFSDTFYTSKIFAKGLKSKVLLYKKDYSQAAQAALEVIELENRTLEDTFADIFIKKIIDTKEVLFQTPFDNLNDRNNKAFIFRAYYLPSEYYVDFMEGDARKDAAIAYTTSGAARNAKFNNSTYNGVPLTADTEYFLRLDEVYLIFAEAVLRGDDDSGAALDALNKIRERSENPLITTTNKAELLEIIRNEKIFELGAESGEDWFDLVRFHKEGDLDINSFKTISSDSKLILPIPMQSVDLSDGLIIQNPDY